MRELILSINPKWCEQIANGSKTIEIRRQKPKCELPFKVYIYCTKPSKKNQTIKGCMVLNSDELFRDAKSRIKHGSSIELMGEENYTEHNFMNGKVIGEFVCNKISEYYYDDFVGAIDPDTGREITQPKEGVGTYWIVADEGATALTLKEICDYGKGKTLYGWHISDLVIYDEPKKLLNFGILRPPQSYCFKKP